MKLNQGCIHDILLFVDKNTNNDKDYVSVDELLVALSHDKDTIIYHIDEMNDINLFDNIYYHEGKPQFISKLSWIGHDYINNIHDNN